TVRIAFYAGGAVLLLAIVWTVLRSREYPPEVLRSFDDAEPPGARVQAAVPSAAGGLPWLALGAVGLVLIWATGWGRLLYVLAALPLAYGMMRRLGPRAAAASMFASLAADLHAMPLAMRQLAVVQFFSWFGLFCMWIYTT